jgi:hypothetical protein
MRMSATSNGRRRGTRGGAAQFPANLGDSVKRLPTRTCNRRYHVEEPAMAGHTVTFGRRGNPRGGRRASRVLGDMRAEAARSGSAMAEPPRPAPASPSLDDELRDWKRERRRHYAPPWRQLSLMASLSFGIGSLVLSGSVGSAVQWLLDGLAAASLVAGLRRRA